MAETSVPTTAEIRDAFALYRLNTDEDRDGLTIEQCQERVASYRAGFDLWAEQNGVPVVLEEPVPMLLEVGPRE